MIIGSYAYEHREEFYVGEQMSFVLLLFASGLQRVPFYDKRGVRDVMQYDVDDDE